MNSLGRFLMRASVGETVYEEDVDVPEQEERDKLVDKNLDFSGDVEKITEKEFDGGLGLSTEDSSDSTEIKPRLTPGGEKQSARVKNSPIWDGGRNVPNERLFGRTQDSLDSRLWNEDSTLRPEVAKSILERVGENLKGYDPVTKDGWKDWTRVYFAGSQASFWGGNNDVDILIGVAFDKLKHRNPAFELMSPEDISDIINTQLRQSFNNDEWSPEWTDDVFELTGFVNHRGWDIRDLRPYAAYEILDEEWYVEPLHMPFWSPSKFPQGPGLWKYLNGIVAAVHGIMEMPDPYRSAQASALWDFIRENRSTAFDEGGHGWYDVPNVLEKYLDQLGLWSELYHLQKAFKSGGYDKGEDWDNDPRNRPYSGSEDNHRVAKTLMQKHSTMIAIHPPAGVLDHLLPKRKAEDSSKLHLTLCCLEDDHDPGHLAELPDVVEMWAENLDPVDLQVGGIGTFINDGKHVLWASVDHPDLHRLHESLTMFLEEHGYNVKQNYGFTPHITLGYDNTHYRFIPKLERKVPFTAHDVLVHVGDYPGGEQEVYQVSFGGENEEG